MEHNYDQFIENLQKRRYDEALKEPILSEGFKTVDYPDCVKYALEAMQEIDASYAYKVYNNSRRIHNKINNELKNKGIEVEYRYQGALKTYTNIVLYGDIEIIVLKKNPSDRPQKDIYRLGNELMDILIGDSSFKSIDYSDKTRIKVIALKPTCEIDILPSIWVDTPTYLKSKNEIYRGIAEFNFVNKKVRKYLPFLSIARINAMDQRLGGNLKSLSRLLLTLQKDSKNKIDLTHTEINALLYALPENDLKVESNQLLSLLPSVAQHLNKLATNDHYFKSLVSPSGMERVFANNPTKKEELAKLHDMLRALLTDIKKALAEQNLTINDRIKLSPS